MNNKLYSLVEYHSIENEIPTATWNSLPHPRHPHWWQVEDACESSGFSKERMGFNHLRTWQEPSFQQQRIRFPFPWAWGEIGNVSGFQRGGGSLASRRPWTCWEGVLLPVLCGSKKGICLILKLLVVQRFWDQHWWNFNKHLLWID